MGKIYEQKINRFDSGIVADPRSSVGARVISNFNALSDPHRLKPYNSTESGDDSASTSKKRDFTLAIRTGTTWNFYALGVKSGAATAEVLMKSLTDLADDTWDTPTNNQSSSGSKNDGLFVYYKHTTAANSRIYGARASRYIWAFDPTSAQAWNDSELDLTSFTNIAQGLVHSKDDILYIPYDNKIASNNQGSWTAAALTLPSHLYITSICEYGNYLAIACAPLAGVGRSVVYLWDRDASLTTLSESIDWGSGVLKIIEEVDGVLIGITLEGNTSLSFNQRVIFKYLSGGEAIKFAEFLSSTTQLPIGKQKANNRLYFLMKLTINGTVRDGLWSIGRTPNRGMTLYHEQTINNNADGSNYTLNNFFILGDYNFISYNNGSAEALSKTTDGTTYSINGIYESLIFGEDSSKTKKLIGATVMTEALPTNGSITLSYMKDEESSWTEIFTDGTDNSISHSAINTESDGATLPEFKEIQFQIKATGGAVVTGLKFKYEELDKDIY